MGEDILFVRRVGLSNVYVGITSIVEKYVDQHVLNKMRLLSFQIIQ